MKRDLFKEYKKNKLRDKEVVFNKIFSILFYIGIIILCSIGATFIANKLGIINIF